MYLLRFSRRITRRIWRLLRRLFRAFFYSFLLVSLCFGAFSVGVSAADPPAFGTDYVRPVGETFSNTDYRGVFTGSGLKHQGQFMVFTPIAFQQTMAPSAGLSDGVMVTGWGKNDVSPAYWYSYSNGNAIMSKTWVIPLDTMSLVADKEYYFAIEKVVGKFRSERVLPFTVTFFVTFDVADSTGHSVVSQRLIDYLVVDPYAGGLYVGDWNELNYPFSLPGDLTGYTLNLSVGFLTGPSNPIQNTQLQGDGSPPYVWFFFDGAGIYETDEDGAWQDEQRGFWGNVLEWLNKLWNGILDIPEKIGEFFSNLVDSIGNWFAQLGQWFTELGDKIAAWFQEAKDFIMHLFVPEEGEIQAVVDDFKAYAEGKLGFVMQIDDLVRAIIEPLVNGGNGGDAILTFPGFTLPAFLGGVSLWQDTQFNLTGVVNSSPAMTNIYSVYKVLASVVLLGLLLRYLYRVAADILGQRDGDDDV